MARRCAGAACGLVADVWLGEPPIEPHPVARFGRLMSAVEARIYHDNRGSGAAYAAIGVGTGMAAGAAMPSTALATYGAVAGRALRDAATDVAQALERGDVAEARCLVRALVGREPEALDAKEIVRAIVESVAENTVDAIVAPALWGAVAGASGTLGYRALNTLDAMVGHRSERYEHFGWASARGDDIANWVPARLTAALVMAVRPSHAAEVWRVVRRDAGAHPSPNAGVAEAAFAAALGLRLGGENRYAGRLELRPPLGDGRPPEVDDVRRACSLARDVSMALAAALVVVAGVQAAPLRTRRGRRRRRPAGGRRGR
jgi:adenosylcobinamide-phosphate synthase